MKNFNQARKIENYISHNDAIDINNGSFPSIYESELRKNDFSQENRLTSRFFGHISRLPPDLRKLILVRIGLIAEEDGDIQSLELWPSYNRKMKPHAELDVLIHLPTSKIGVEVKFESAIKADQLIREYCYLQKRYSSSSVRLTTITNDFEKPEEIKRAEDLLKVEIFWTSWIRCSLMIDELSSEFTGRNDIYFNVKDLRTYFKSRGIEMHEGFKETDDWTRYVRVLNMIDELRSPLNKRFKKRGYENFEKFEKGYPDIPVQGFWGYRELENEEERGLWLGIGFINGENQIQFSAYEEIQSSFFEPLIGTGYTKHITGKEAGWAHDYKLYSRYLSLRELQRPYFEAQSEEILAFVDGCLNEIDSIKIDGT